MENSLLQSLMTPPAGERLGPFLGACAKAIMGSSDADLARAMGIAPALLANWKRRGSVPLEHRAWFGRELPRLVFENNGYLRPCSGRAVYAATLILLTSRERFEGDGLRDAEFWAGLLPGIIAMAELVSSARDPLLREDFLASGLQTAHEVSAALAEVYPRRFKLRTESPQ